MLLDTVRVEISEVAYGGYGVARQADGKVVFVPGVLPGEEVEVRLVRRHERYDEGELQALRRVSPARITPGCPLALGPREPTPPSRCCPGCAYQHVSYAEEVRLKQEQFRSLLTRAGAEAGRLGPPLPALQAEGYRNRMELHAQVDGPTVRLGYYGTDSRTVVDVPQCPIVMPALNTLLAGLRQTAGLPSVLGDGARVTFRYTQRDGALWWVGRAGPRAVWLRELTTLGELAVPRDSFFQVNPEVSAKVFSWVTEWLRVTAPAAVVDLYCGVGVFALAAARTGIGAVWGVDTDCEAIRAAEYNARELAVGNVRWLAGPVARTLVALGAEIRDPRLTVTADPPRAGLGRRVVHELLRWRPATIIYVSCAADTLARDVAWLRSGGYVVIHGQLFDMFPRTRYFEAVVVLQRAEGSSVA